MYTLTIVNTKMEISLNILQEFDKCQVTGALQVQELVPDIRPAFSSSLFCCCCFILF